MRDAFDLDPRITHLNHGSFGAVPRVVAEEQRRWRDRAEANPMRFFKVESPALRARARETAADLLEVGPDEVAMVRNVTQAVSTVLSSLAAHGALGPGDVVLLADQGYESVRRSVDHWCGRTGAAYDVVAVPVVASPELVVEAFRSGCAAAARRGDRVALVVVDQVSSPTGAVLPVREVASVAREAGALVLVDAAHAPGHLPALPAESGADFWTGTWHKWGFAPRGTSALWVCEEQRDGIAPLSTSWNSHLDFAQRFDIQGTDDYSAWFSLGAAAAFWRDAGGPEIAKQAVDLLDDGAAAVQAVLPETGVAVPERPAPCLRLVPLPDGVADTEAKALGLYEAVSRRRVEAQVLAFGGRGWIRLSGTAYNEPADYQRLADVLPAALEEQA